MRIALDARLVGTTAGGDATYWDFLIEGLSHLGIEVLAFTRAKPPSRHWPNVEWIHLPAANGRLWSLMSFPRAARRMAADVIHTQYSISPLVKDRGVTTVHDVSFFIGPEWFPPKHRFLLRRTVPAAVRRARRVITVSETSARELEQYIPAGRGKTRAVPNAANPRLVQIPVDQARSILGSTVPEGPFALTVSSLWARKNAALGIAATKGLGLPLVLTGKPLYGETERAPHVHFTGYVDERTLSALYSLASLYLCPSRHEGFGIPVLEAMALGCPVLASSGGALPEVVGDAGRVMPTWNPNDWRSAITELLANPSKLAEMREKGLARAAEFSWDRTARETLAVYREVTG